MLVLWCCFLFSKTFLFELSMFVMLLVNCLCIVVVIVVQVRWLPYAGLLFARNLMYYDCDSY